MQLKSNFIIYTTVVVVVGSFSCQDGQDEAQDGQDEAQDGQDKAQGSPKWLGSMSPGLPDTLTKSMRQPVNAIRCVLGCFLPSKRWHPDDLCHPLALAIWDLGLLGEASRAWGIITKNNHQLVPRI